jgi:hypothetical protein
VAVAVAARSAVRVVGERKGDGGRRRGRGRHGRRAGAGGGVEVRGRASGASEAPGVYYILLVSLFVGGKI